MRSKNFLIEKKTPMRKDRVEQSAALKNLIRDLRDKISREKLTLDAVRDGAVQLKAIDEQFAYDFKKYPLLDNNAGVFTVPKSDSPTSLAEAFLWKNGYWPRYQTFVNDFNSANPEVPSERMVFFAFARHLKDQINPIYDQHSLRAILRIDTKLSVEQKNTVVATLNAAKGIGGSQFARESYEIFVESLKRLSEGKGKPSMGDLDRLLLMPLGKALKLLKI